MNKVLIIGCGGVGTVAAYKCAQYPEVFHEIVIASRRKEKCDEVAKAIARRTSLPTRWMPTMCNNWWHC